MPLVSINAVIRRPSALLLLPEETRSFAAILKKEIWWFSLIPPSFLFIGTYFFGWRIGAEEPLYFEWPVLLSICIFYYMLLFGGLLILSLLSRWMAPTYATTKDLGSHLTVIVTSAAPLFLGSVAHLYPHIIVNSLVFIPMLLWSLWVLYSTLPDLLKTDPQRGMLHASSLVGIVMVAGVSLIGMSVVFWTLGIGPTIGV